MISMSYCVECGQCIVISKKNPWAYHEQCSVSTHNNWPRVWSGIFYLDSNVYLKSLNMNGSVTSCDCH